MKKDFSYGVIPVIAKGQEYKFLLICSAGEDGYWGFPKGHKETGESNIAAARRELFEETGIKLEDLEFICEEEVLWNYCRSATAHYLYLFRTSVTSPNIVLDKTEAASLAWYTVEEIKKLNLEPVWKYWFEKIGIL